MIRTLLRFRSFARPYRRALLDEPTSALDAASEELPMAALDNLPADRTRLTIAHRPSTVRCADRIFVLVGGRLVESGSHDELVTGSGVYQRMTSLQTGHARLATALPVTG